MYIEICRIRIPTVYVWQYRIRNRITWLKTKDFGIFLYSLISAAGYDITLKHRETILDYNYFRNLKNFNVHAFEARTECCEETYCLTVKWITYF